MPPRRRFAPVLAVLAVVALVVGLLITLATFTARVTPRSLLGGFAGPVSSGRAPELAGLTNWINGEPTTMAALQQQRRVVLIDFWTYTCVNCIRTLPYLKQWNDRYASAGLTIIGVHAPEFEFEHDPANVRRAVEANGMKYPVASDNDMRTWDAFSNNAWPAKYLVGADGQVRYSHLGEGDYDVTERAIREALTAAGHDVSAIPTGGLPAPERDPNARSQTRELYGGTERNYATRGSYAAQSEYYAGQNQVVDYTDAGARGNDVWYLQGRWRNGREAIVHARATQNLEDYLAFRFTARSVNAVMHPGANGASYDVIIEIDGRPLARNEAGSDIRFDAAGRSIVTVSEPRMYSLAILPEVSDRELKMRSNSDAFSMYAITFGTYTEGA